jgi:thiamine pyrophosphate-dependent acetolactate synthase large subunit-like protein
MRAIGKKQDCRVERSGSNMTVDEGYDNLDRRKVVAELFRDRADLLVVSGLGSSTYDVFAASNHDSNMHLWGATGGASLIGLGLALAQPERPVVVITGMVSN